MHHQLFLSTPSISIFTFFFIGLVFILPISYSQDYENFMQCLNLFDCGNLKNLTFPFWTEDRDQICRHDGFKLTECRDPAPVIDIGGSGNEFRLIYFNHSTYTMTIARNDLWEGICRANRTNVTLGYPFLQYPKTNRNLTFFYDCDSSVKPPPSVPLECSPGSHSFYVADLVEGGSYENFNRYCPGGAIQVQVNQSAFDELETEGPKMLGSGRWRLGFDVAYNPVEIVCPKCDSLKEECKNLSPNLYSFCNRGNHFNLKTNLIVGFSAAAAGVIITCFACYIWQRHHRGKGVFKSSFVTGRKSSSDRTFMMDSEKGDSYAGSRLFTYNELKEATNNFDSDRELGDGGFGTVYYGKLRDGRAVAVKRLYENNRRVEQFMNEVEILTRLRHQNLVALYGCTSRHSRELLLVYEYVPNGTVADHLHGERAKPGALSWHIRLEIAIETANALIYLHASDIIHRDVKTNNILLGNNFVVKVADFGLSRLFPTDVTHVSTAPQGTPGYVDPEYHQCYQLTDKSDVFSYGVVLIELISSKLAFDITRPHHEINLWNMAINKILSRALHELVDPSLGFESNPKVRNMITGVAGVAFQCLQNGRDMRPTMAEVLEALMVIQNEDYNKQKAEVLEC